MDKTYNPKDVEEKLYQMWEEKGYFKPKIDKTKKPFTILLPPPNASGKMHTGNVLMIAIEDLLIRWHRMKGEPTLWIPGTDHAGFETQTTFERELKKQGKSRFDFDRNTLYQMIWDFVHNNKSIIEKQIRQMGASVDWSRNIFTLDEEVVKTISNTFERMVKDGTIYRGYQLVNYSFKWGTTFSDAEIQYKERTDTLYYIRYEIINRAKDEQQYLTVATVRPETIFIDTHLAVNPKDKKNKQWEGREVKNPLTGKPMKVISDTFVNPEFGTGIVKLTPAHDKADNEVAMRRKELEIPIKSIINHEGRINIKAKEEGVPELYGLKIPAARENAVALLDRKKLIEKVNQNYIHQVPVDYRSGDYIENLLLPNWFVKTDDIKKPAYDAIKNGIIKIYPKSREVTYLQWIENMRDWAISRQIVWGIRIPVWYKITDQNKKDFWVIWIDENKVQHKNTLDVFLDQGVNLVDIKKGLQRVVTLTSGAEKDYIISQDEPNDDGYYIPETDTFDTWFSSGQWPLVTLNYPDSEDFQYFYPTSVIETGWEILRLWVSRMVMFGIYLTGKSPFEKVYLHGRVLAPDGRKMSKSLGNVINPEEYIEEYGVDALRMGLIAGTATGKDFAFPKDKIIAYKHFANKIWNMARFMLMLREQHGKEIPSFAALDTKHLKDEDKKILKALEQLIKTVDRSLEQFRFTDAAEALYHFMWHEIADKYIEHVKSREDKDIALAVLEHVYLTSLKLLHPFMPFVTEEIYQKLPEHSDSIMIEQWPSLSKK